MNTYQGSCHCGAVKYEVTGEFTSAIQCNCSHCSRKGFLLTFVPTENFKLLSGEDAQTVYHFNKNQIDHSFCKTCGVESYAYGHDENGNYMYAINLNCVDGIDRASLEITPYDGASV